MTKKNVLIIFVSPKEIIIFGNQKPICLVQLEKEQSRDEKGKYYKIYYQQEN